MEAMTSPFASAALVASAAAQVALALALSTPAVAHSGKRADSLADAPGTLAVPSEEVENREDAARDRRRILHLRSGEIVRSRCRFQNETWELWQKATWQPLPADAVLRAVDEKVVLDQADRLERQTRGDPLARAALAEWMVRQGLYAEAVEQLDRVLEEAPDCEPALALLPRIAPHFDLGFDLEPGESTGSKTGEEPGPEPVPFEVLLRHGARGGACIQELVILRLGAPLGLPSGQDLEEGSQEQREALGQGALFAHLRASLKSSSPGMRAFAARALQRLYPGRAIGELSARAVLDSSSEARRAAVGALRAAVRNEGEEIASPMLSCLANQHGAVRTNAIQALGDLGLRSSVAPMMAHLAALSAASGSFRPSASHIFVGKQIAYVQDFDVEVSQNAAIADPSINVLHEGSVLDVRLLSVSAPGMLAREGRCLREALSKLTGTTLGTNKAWLDWWAQNRSRYEEPKSAPTGPITPAGTPPARTSGS
jgi:hypothetical protein